MDVNTITIIISYNFFLTFLTVMDENTITTIMDLIERYIVIRLYRFLFCPVTTDDEERYLAIQDRIRGFHWVNTQILEAQINESVRKLVDQAITGWELVSKESSD